MTLTEATVETAALNWFESLGYCIGHGPDIAPGQRDAERESFRDVVLVDRLREAVDRLNPSIPEVAKEDAIRQVLRLDATSLVGRNRVFHKMLRDGVAVEYQRAD